ncbi:hypothetical protein MMC10_006631 [Thelotrema lepadinum]|nr:hypothetical protein [Thelotrema lepadinum]
MDGSSPYRGFSRPVQGSRGSTTSYAPYDGQVRTPKPRLEGLYTDKKRKETLRLAKDARRAQHVVDKSFADKQSIGEDEIRYLYGIIKSNIRRIARTYFNGIVPAFPDEADSSGNTEGGATHGSDSIDYCKQVEFFSNWSPLREVRTLRVSGKIFELVYDNIFKALCFGAKIEDEGQLATTEALEEHKRGEYPLPQRAKTNVQLVLPSKCRDWRLETIEPALCQENRYSRAEQAASRIMAFMKPVRWMTEPGHNVFRFATAVQTEISLLCKLALDLSLATKATSCAYYFRSIDVGTPINNRKEADFEVEAFVGGEQLDYFESCDVESCDVAATVFHALLRSRSPGSRPTLLIEKATVLAYSGPCIELDFDSRNLLSLQGDDLRTQRPLPQHAGQMQSQSFWDAKNIVKRRIADEL